MSIETFNFSFVLNSLNLISLTLIRMLRFWWSTYILPSAFRSFIMSLSGPQASSLLWRYMIFNFILLPVYNTSVQEWHSTCVRASLFSHDEFSVYSHFKLRWVYPSTLYRNLSNISAAAPSDTWWPTMRDGSVLGVRSVYRETSPVSLTSLIL